MVTDMSNIAKIIVPEMQPLVVHAMKAGGYSRAEARIEYSPALARDSDGRIIVNVTRDQAREIAKAAGYRLSTATEEQKLSERGYKDEAFNDNFGRNPEGEWFWNPTDTGLLKPKGEKEDYTMKKNGRTYWKRIVTEGGEKVGEVWVPQSGIAREWSVFGIPSETAQDHNDGTETHFYFNAVLDEIALSRGRHWSDPVHCFRLDARWGPGYSDPGLGLRLVRGSVGKYEKIEGKE